MSEHANEESEMSQEFGQLVRVLTGSGMQVQESRMRREQLRSWEQSRSEQQQQAQDKAMAELVNQRVHDRDFWATAGSEAVADNVTVAAHLSSTQPKAQKAYMYASDMLRNEYGINLEDINRDHPTSLNDRHAALRDALDSYFARQNMNTDRVAEPIVIDETLTVESKERLAIERDGPIVIEPSEPVEQDEAKLRQAEQASSAKADRHHAEHQQDQKHALTESMTGGREPHPYQRVSSQQYEQLRSTTSEWLANTRHRQSLMFAQSSKDRVFNGRAKQINMPKPQNKAFKGKNRQQDVGLVR